MRHPRKDYNERFQDAHGIVPGNEPVFLLRGQDLAAPVAVEAWANEAERLGTDPETVARVRRWADEMREYQAEGPSKVPDTPKGLLL